MLPPIPITHPITVLANNGTYIEENNFSSIEKPVELPKVFCLDFPFASPEEKYSAIGYNLTYAAAPVKPPTKNDAARGKSRLMASTRLVCWYSHAVEAA